MIALGSVPSTTLVTSPSRFVTIKPIASQYSHLEPRQSPTAAAAQKIETGVRITTAHRPRLERFSCARGLSSHIDSRKLVESSNDMLAVRLTALGNGPCLSPAQRNGLRTDERAQLKRNQW